MALRQLPSLRLSVFFLVVITACGSAAPSPPPRTPQPTPHLLKVATTPAVRPMRPALQACARAHPEIALQVDEIPASHPQFSAADLGIQLGGPTPDAVFAAPLAEERIVVIAHPDNPISGLTAPLLGGLLQGEFRRWTELAPGQGIPASLIRVWDYPQGDELRQILLGDLQMAGEPPHPNAALAPDPGAMLAAVAADPGAIGYVPQAWLTPDVRVVPLSQDLTAALTRPVVASSPTTPSVSVQDFIICLQTKEGQSVLQDRYLPWDGS